MYLPVPTASTCAIGWIAAAQKLIEAGDEAYNVVVDIEDPVSCTAHDQAIIRGLDGFLRERGAYSVATVANTVFPKDLYRRYGAADFQRRYLRTFDRLGSKKGWGRYFERMIQWQNRDGAMTDQLQDLVENVAKQRGSNQTYRHVYEMTLYDPTRDATRTRGRQCLSFLSFKLHPDRGLMLTALYRNHHYVARALGNFISLGHLMSYVAEQAGTKVGPLTCVSTHAEVDTLSNSTDKTGNGGDIRGWGVTEARTLIKRLAASRSSAVAEDNG
jgi:hypothetical protein